MSNDSIDKMGAKYKSIEELRIYSDAQYKTIKKLSKKIAEHENTIAELRQGIDSEKEAEIMYQAPEGLSDQEAICILELSKLHLNSQQRELNLEETRKVETYVKTLYLIRESQADAPPKTSKLSDEELLNALANPDSIGTTKEQ